MMYRPLQLLIAAPCALGLLGLGTAAAQATAPAQQVTKAASASAVAAVTPISFVSSTTASANALAPVVTVPSTVKAGDTLLLTASLGNATTASGPAGWTLAGDQNATAALRSLVWTRTATAVDAGTSVAVTMEAIHKSVLVVSAYRGADTSQAVKVTSSTDVNTTSHLTPAASVPTDSRVVSFYAERGAATTRWTTPAAATLRASAFSTGGGKVSAAVVDPNASSSGSIAGATATTDAVSTQGVNWTIVLPAVIPAPVSRTVFGMNLSPGALFTNGATETAAQQVNRIVSTYGDLGVAKVFYPGNLPATFNKAYEGEVPGKVAAVCFKPDQTALANGSLDASIKSYVDSIPEGWKILLVNWQEPDDEIWVDHKFTAAQHRAATERLIDDVHTNAAYAADRVEVWDVWMGYSLDSGRWQDAAASPRLDGIGWDYYWNKPTTNWNADPNVALKKMADTTKRIGIKDWGLFETGDNPHANDVDGSGRSAFWTKVYDGAEALDYHYVMYFNAIGTTGDHRILPGTAFGGPLVTVLRTRMYR